MGRYLASRLLAAVLLLVLVATATFAVFFLLPATDPAALRAGRSGDPQLLAAIRADLGLDRPRIEQYARYMSDVALHFDFGNSYASGTREPVLDLILERLPVTVALTAGAAFLWLLAGVPLGVFGASRERSLGDHIATAVTLLALCMPVYWLGLVALYLFAEDIGALVPALPGAGSYSPLAEDPVRWVGSFVLPCIVLAIPFAAVYARFLRATLIETLDQDFVRTARAKGVPERAVLWRHGVRVGLTPLVSLLGVDIGALLGGAVLVEIVFSLPGLGTLAYGAIQQGDLPVVQGTVLFGAVFVVAANLAVDVAYAVVDPRVRAGT